MQRTKLFVSEAVRSIGANLSTTVAATMTVLIGMFLLGLFIALGSWVISWTNHCKDVLVQGLLRPSDARRDADQRSAREALTLPETKTVIFISKDEALKQMEAKYPGARPRT